MVFKEIASIIEGSPIAILQRRGFSFGKILGFHSEETRIPSTLERDEAPALKTDMVTTMERNEAGKSMLPGCSMKAVTSRSGGRGQ